jgi:cold shock protein
VHEERSPRALRIDRRRSQDARNPSTVRGCRSGAVLAPIHLQGAPSALRRLGGETATDEEEGGSALASGTVRWFNEESGYGYIVADEGGDELFVHRGSIVGSDWRTRTLVEGARVGFDLREGGMCPEAIHVLKLAAKGCP